MSILLREGFGNLSNGTHTAGTTKEILGEQWASFAQNFGIEDRADGRKWMVRDASTNRYVALNGGEFGGIATASLCFRVVRGGTTQNAVYRLLDGTNVVGQVWITASGSILYGRSGTSTAPGDIAFTSTGTIPALTETYVEVRVTIHDSTGSVHVYFNGVLDSFDTNIDTKGTGTVLRSLIFLPPSYGALFDGWKFSDLVVHADASPIGDVGVYYKPVDGDIGTPDLTPSAVGANTLMVDEVGPDEDTTYNESDGTAGHRDQFSAAGLTGMTILEVCALVRARKTDVGTATLLLGMKENLTEDQSAAKALSEAYSTLIEGWATNPDTAAAWTAQQAIDALISYEVGA